MNPKIFISRELKEDSIFRTRLEAMGGNVTGVSLIEFTPVAFSAVPFCEWVFFYSPRAVRFFFKGLGAQLRPDIQWAALGRGTAAALYNQGITPDFIGAGAPEGVAEAFAREAAGLRVLFPQARHSRQTVEKALKGQIHAIPLAVYDNRPRREFDIPFCEVLVFTSPMNAEAYFEKYSLQTGQVALAIGATTAAALHQMGITKVRVAPEPSEAALAAAVEALILGPGEE
ncbi:MAG: uroporphyrinogen-III synthase [Lewinellaceae bacterium]|nr:uroporphyrinogen-III synthase [Phaeodactylibacter sp.]MCB0613255.1 uroporphyrinogen-III synthase [Phaeodactylibacter sp.]MCB9350614.1 uroporphyrinogen-III synthase [Lewinellaceae bacterium]